MSDIAIKVSGLGKEYQLGVQKSASFRESFTGLFNKKEKSQEDTFWALKSIDFEIKKGEAVGIIGRNGAGKSTLLKILSRITEPTKGKIEIDGRMASLLEVGTGFHPELTGRENIFLNGTILGMKRKEVKTKFNEIVAFSGVEKFIDTPVKRYSSGMYVRLAFAVAAHLEPEILVIDEVLAVGDAEFQKKCLGKMEDVAQQGRTVLFVSHNMLAVQNLCTNSVLIEDGRVVMFDETKKVLDTYLNSASNENLLRYSFDDLLLEDKMKLNEVYINASHDSEITVEDKVFLNFDFEILNSVSNFAFNFQIFTSEGTHVFNCVINMEKYKDLKIGAHTLCCEIPNGFLNDNHYMINLLVLKDSAIVLHRFKQILHLNINEKVENRKGWMGKVGGVIRPNFEWKAL